MEFQIVDVVPRSIIYLERASPAAPEAIGAALSEAYDTLFGLLSEQRIRPVGAPLAIYDACGPDRASFRAGFPVSEEDCRRASESALCGESPGGRALRAVHRGPRSSLSQTYDAMTAWLKEQGLERTGPAWEVYLSDNTATPAEARETEIYLSI